jgi:GNAT superfamily N-acetyltransferase
MRLTAPQSVDDWREARRLIVEYVARLDVDLSFQDIAQELEHMPEVYGPPSGAFLLASEGGAFLGCVGLRRFEDGVAEMKRLYSVPAVRGKGLGRQLAEGIVAAARGLGYTAVVLDTLPSMREAQGLYASLGFKPTRAYRYNPVPGTVYLELDLARPA